MKAIHLLSFLLAGGLLLAGCHSHEQEYNHDHAHPEKTARDHGHSQDASHAGEEPHRHGGDHSHAPGASGRANEAVTPAGGLQVVTEVVLTQAQMEKIGLQLGGFEERPLRSVIRVNGHLELPPQNKAHVSAMIGGNVRDIKVLRGDFVQSGELLAVLEHPGFIEMQQDYVEQQSRLDFLEKEYVRQQALADAEIAAKKALQQTEADYRKARSAVAALHAKLEMLGVDPQRVEAGGIFRQIPVRAPIEGYVRAVHVSIGRYVSPEMELFKIGDNHHVHIDLLVYEEDVNRVHEGQKVLFRLPSQPEQEYTATIYAIGKALETEEKAVRVHAEIDNETGRLLPGMYVEGRIITGDERTPSLPESAIVTDKGLDYIFIKDEAQSDAARSHFHKTQVIKGVTDAGYAAITVLEELPENVPVVVKGAFFLMAETKKGESGGGHGHHH